MEQRLAERPSLNLQRHYPVAPEKVWRAWTDPEAVKRWWGPIPGEPVSVAELDVRVGGRFRIVFGGPKGTDNECAGTYKEVVPNKKLVFTWSWPNTTPDRISVVTIEFVRAGTGTDLLFTHEQFYDEAARDGHKRGWTGSLDKLGQFLS
jgi:uncharacterized protein YndB with AHSA1/START domain